MQSLALASGRSATSTLPTRVANPACVPSEVAGLTGGQQVVHGAGLVPGGGRELLAAAEHVREDVLDRLGRSRSGHRNCVRTLA